MIVLGLGTMLAMMQGDIPDPRDPMPVPWKEPGYNKFLWL
jgi:hypothetical protein